MFTLLLIYSHSPPINTVIAARMLPPPLLITNGHYVQSPHTLSPLNDDVSHGSTLCSPSMIMNPMAPYNIPPLNDDGLLMMNRRR